MARFAPALLGSFNPQNPDWRCFFPTGISPGLLLATAAPGISLPVRDAFDVCWRVKTIAVNYAITSSSAGFQSGGTSGLSIIFPIPADERSLICASANVIGFFDGIINIGLILYSFDNSDPANLKMWYSVNIAGAGGGPQLSSSPLGGTFSGVVSNLFGQDIQLYDAPGEHTSGNISVLPDSWWPYDDGKTGLPSNGPIWDGSDGHQLIDPIPLSF